MRLVLTEMAPNGCNDLLILNDEDEVIGFVEECVFGYPRNTAVKPDLSQIYDGTISDSSALNDAELVEAGVTALYTVDIRNVLQQVAVSPLDPHGARVITELKRLNLIKAA